MSKVREAPPGDQRPIVDVDPAGRSAAERFRMSRKQLLETAGIRGSAHYKAERLASPKNEARLREMLEIIHRVADWAGGEDQAMAWYRAQPIGAFGGRTAEALVKEGRAVDVRDYLDHLAMGGFA